MWSQLAGVAELVDAAHSKCAGAILVGSSPTACTKRNDSTHPMGEPVHLLHVVSMCTDTKDPVVLSLDHLTSINPGTLEVRELTS